MEVVGVEEDTSLHCAGIGCVTRIPEYSPPPKGWGNMVVRLYMGVDANQGPLMATTQVALCPGCLGKIVKMTKLKLPSPEAVFPEDPR